MHVDPFAIEPQAVVAQYRSGNICKIATRLEHLNPRMRAMLERVRKRSVPEPESVHEAGVSGNYARGDNPGGIVKRRIRAKSTPGVGALQEARNSLLR